MRTRRTIHHNCAVASCQLLLLCPMLYLSCEPGVPGIHNRLLFHKHSTKRHTTTQSTLNLYNFDYRIFIIIALLHEQIQRFVVSLTLERAPRYVVQNRLSRTCRRLEWQLIFYVCFICGVRNLFANGMWRVSLKYLDLKQREKIANVKWMGKVERFRIMWITYITV